MEGDLVTLCTPQEGGCLSSLKGVSWPKTERTSDVRPWALDFSSFWK